MNYLDQNKLRDLLEISDISFRVASYLRQLKNGRISDDTESVEQAIKFLTQAESGGTLMSSGQLSSDVNSLQPLNWASVIYANDSQEIDYNKVIEYIYKIHMSLNTIKDDSSKATEENFNLPIEFFYELGQMLTSEIYRNNGDEKKLINY